MADRVSDQELADIVKHDIGWNLRQTIMARELIRRRQEDAMHAAAVKLADHETLHRPHTMWARAYILASDALAKARGEQT